MSDYTESATTGGLLDKNCVLRAEHRLADAMRLRDRGKHSDAVEEISNLALQDPGSITLSFPVIANAREVVIAACGVSEKYPQAKSAAMVRAVEAPETLRSFPAAGLRDVATYVFDEAAASKLDAKYRS